jgi:membrane protease YdiL (CAAX protease family)
MDLASLARLRWKSLGLVRYRNWTATFAFGLGGGLAMEILQLFVTQPLLLRLTGKPADLSDFQELIGNLKLLLIYLPLVWTLAAFGEEMVFRGYLMNRVADIFRNKRLAWTVSLITVSALFGSAHMYQGMTGMIDEGLMGLLLGSLYLAFNRGLAVPIIAHGVQDTIDLLLIFFGIYPGLTH